MSLCFVFIWGNSYADNLLTRALTRSLQLIAICETVFSNTVEQIQDGVDKIWLVAASALITVVKVNEYRPHLFIPPPVAGNVELFWKLQSKAD